MRKLSTWFVAIVLSTGISGFAQNDQTPANGQGEHREARHGGRGQGMNADAQLEHMSQALNLTDDQKTRIKPILQDGFKQLQQIRQDSSLSEQDRRAKFQEVHQKMMSDIRPILNADQQKKLDEMRERGGPGGRRAHDHDQGSQPQ
jgi:Spy/CpxP family protein refolding chaperone